MEEQRRRYEEDLVLQFIQVALHAADEHANQELLAHVEVMVGDLHHLWRQQLTGRNVIVPEASVADLQRTGEQVVDHVSAFIRAMMGFSESDSRSHIRRSVQLFRWRDFVEERTIYPILSHVGARVEAAVGQLLLSAISETADGNQAN